MLIVDAAESGQKLLQYLQRRLPDVPRSALMRVIRTGQVRVDGSRAKPFDRLSAGQSVRIPPRMLEAIHQTAPLAQSAPELPVVLETDAFLAVSKPAGLPTHGGDRHLDSAVLRARAMRPAPFALTPVHRLDKATSGLLVFAKSYETLRRLQEAFGAGEAGKFYLAWSAGAWPFDGEKELRHWLRKGGAEGGRELMQTARPGDASAKEAVCRVRPVLVTGGASLLEVELVTGRKHQIRVQLAESGRPVVGDAKYGGPPCRQGLMLHAWRLVLPGASEIRLPPPWRGRFQAPREIA